MCSITIGGANFGGSNCANALVQSCDAIIDNLTTGRGWAT
jgi:hypothetical protein